ncbi:hypothetical protein MW290_24730 [Aquincola tertiaricarbonis]|uniref:Uncharacterized protein n=1 Tax=Aquincola tertiaricarbonis TaxID=391953 RepID=A0ABY4S9S3_AQUTE|nr:hypothetical protein [Aquincola tertiaricarbonis]URI08786.1 hypothetical protein MW290_24730 [Aquincola tertiaricarbonis]
MTPTTALQALIEISKIARHPEYDWPLDLAREVDAIIARAALSAPAQDAQADLIGDCIASECAARTQPAPVAQDAQAEPAKAATEHDIRSTGVSPHNGEHWYKCVKCNASDWIASYGTLDQLCFFSSPCAGRTQPATPAPVIVADDADPDAMNKRHGESYGVDWVYPERKTHAARTQPATPAAQDAAATVPWSQSDADAWAERHGLNIHGGALFSAFEDAATLYLTRTATPPAPTAAQPVPEHVQAVIDAAGEWSTERCPRDWAEADLLKAVATLEGDWPGCEGCDFECGEPCTPATVAEQHAAIDAALAQYEADWAADNKAKNERMLKVLNANRAAPTAAATVPAWQLERMRHIANEWADMATNGPQWLKNIRDGISTVPEALEALEKDYAHCRAVNDAPGLYGAATPPAAPQAAQPAGMVPLTEIAGELLFALDEIEKEKSDYMLRKKLGDPSRESTNMAARAAIAKARAAGITPAATKEQSK